MNKQTIDKRVKTVILCNNSHWLISPQIYAWKFTYTHQTLLAITFVWCVCVHGSKSSLIPDTPCVIPAAAVACRRTGSSLCSPPLRTRQETQVVWQMCYMLLICDEINCERLMHFWHLFSTDEEEKIWSGDKNVVFFSLIKLICCLFAQETLDKQRISVAIWN